MKSWIVSILVLVLFGLYSSSAEIGIGKLITLCIYVYLEFINSMQAIDDEIFLSNKKESYIFTGANSQAKNRSGKAQNDDSSGSNKNVEGMFFLAS